jgi:hypothetical protein
MQLRQSLVVTEPVKRLTGGDGLDAVVGQGNVLRRAE